MTMTELRPEDLRIGNYVKRFNKTLRINSIRKDNTYYIGGEFEGNGLTYDTIDAFNPIPLSEDWLKRFGFYKERTGDRLTIEAWSPGHPSQRFNIDFKDGKILLISRYQGDSDSLTMIHIESIHHLQNLFHSLTGAELKAGK